MANCTACRNPAVVSWLRTPLTLTGFGKPTPTIRSYRSIPALWNPDSELPASMTSLSPTEESIESEATRSGSPHPSGSYLEHPVWQHSKEFEILQISGPSSGFSHT
jgi:hypothetical protein